MTTTFWISFVVSEALGVAEAFIALSTIPPGIKAALTGFITAGNALITAIQVGA